MTNIAKFLKLSFATMKKSRVERLIVYYFAIVVEDFCRDLLLLQLAHFILRLENTHAIQGTNLQIGSASEFYFQA